MNFVINDFEKQYSVSEISNILKSVVEEEFRYVRIRGEISGLKTASSGHTYFSLKDQNSILSAICWRGILSKSNFKIEEGLEVICIGSITIYSGQSKYQLIVDKIESAGIGTLMAVLLDRKNKLEKEGLF
ncbi:MAG: exodeoxyribonuclease VII large subunit, partial [Rickettsiales bacterium]